MEVFDLVEHVAHARRGEHHVDLVHAGRLVGLDQPALEPPERDVVRASQQIQLARLQDEQLVERVEPALVHGQLRLENVQLRLRLRDVALQEPNLHGHDGDLLRHSPSHWKTGAGAHRRPLLRSLSCCIRDSDGEWRNRE